MSHKTCLTQVNCEQHTRINIRQCKYFNNMIEQDHRRMKRLTRPRLGFKNFYAAQRTFAGIEVMAMSKKGLMNTAGET
ncbi:MAG: DDE-type integrase/transposase/recombinase [Nitrospirales bacterium]